MVVRLGAAFFASFASVVATGGAPALTLSVLGVIGHCILIAIIVVCWERRIDGRLTQPMRFGAALVGVVGIWMTRWPVLWAPVAIISVAVLLPTFDRTTVARMGKVIVAAFLGYGAVWNANVLVARLAAERMANAWFRAADLFVYNRIGFGDGSYAGVFPLIDTPWLLQLLHQSYWLIMVELFVVLVLAARRDGEMADRILTLVFASYAIGLICFLVLPAVGPGVAYPESLDLAALPLDARIVMREMADGFQTAASGVRQPVSAYFVAMPSLHVLLALILQRTLKPFPLASALFTPVNVLVVLSSLVLGYHYILDVVAAFLLFPIMLILCEGWRRPVPTAAAL